MLPNAFKCFNVSARFLLFITFLCQLLWVLLKIFIEFAVISLSFLFNIAITFCLLSFFSPILSDSRICWRSFCKSSKLQWRQSCKWWINKWWVPKKIKFNHCFGIYKCKSMNDIDGISIYCDEFLDCLQFRLLAGFFSLNLLFCVFAKLRVGGIVINKCWYWAGKN